jgi:5-methylcytosine-specific restriction endonuclease McrA
MTRYRIKHWREAAYKRQAGLCYWCDQPMLLIAAQDHPRFCTAEHVTRKADGGHNSYINIVAACFECNNGRHRRPVKRHAK